MAVLLKNSYCGLKISLFTKVTLMKSLGILKDLVSVRGVTTGDDVRIVSELNNVIQQIAQFLFLFSFFNLWPILTLFHSVDTFYEKAHLPNTFKN